MPYSVALTIGNPNTEKESGSMSDEPVELTKEEQAELNEAVQAEASAGQYLDLARECARAAERLRDTIATLTGRDNEGPAAYLRAKALEKLEECMHRVGDYVNMMHERRQMMEQAARVAEFGKMKVVKGGEVRS